MPDIIHKPCPFVACGSSDAFSYHTEKRVGKCHSCGGNYPSREEVAERLLKYLEKEVKLGTKVNHIMRHAVGLYHGQNGSKKWKRYLSDNMMARDSDFQKAKHIMTIVQNNEKANQISS